jgi:hypothetical protein
MFAIAHKTSSNGRKWIILVWVREWSPQLLKDPSQQDTWLVSLQDDASFHEAGAFPDGYGACSDGPLPREMRF